MLIEVKQVEESEVVSDSPLGKLYQQPLAGHKDREHMPSDTVAKNRRVYRY